MMPDLNAKPTPGLPRLLRNLSRRSRRQTKPGSRPGSIVVDPQAPTPVITAIRFNTAELTEERDLQAGQLAKLLSDHHVTWINVDGLGDAATIRTIGQTFGIHQLVLEDIVNVHQRSKVEEFEQHLFIVARMVNVEEQLQSEQIGIILGPNYVLTFQERVGDCLDAVRRRLRKSLGRIRTGGADYLAYAILDAIIDGYFPVLDHYSERLDLLEEVLVASKPNQVVSEIHRLRRELYLLRRAMWPHREMVNSLLRDMQPWFADETKTHLRDCYDHTIQILDTIDTSREIASDVREFHFTQISLRQNEIMKVLTIVASVFIPLGFVTGIYGMNFDSRASAFNMPETQWKYGYPFALAVMATMACGMLYAFWKRGWLSD
jgi:magnesium transporter